jgi:transcriptional regulator with XRE-family HTH domain
VREKTFGPWLRERRKEAGMSLRELAKQANISFSYLSKVETVELPPPSTETLDALGAAMCIDSLTMHLQAGKVTPFILGAFSVGISPAAYQRVFCVLQDDTERSRQ